MKKFKLLCHIIASIIIVAIGVGSILWTLTYNCVPYQAVHEIWGQDLHTYLIWSHATDTVVTVVILIIINIGIHFGLVKEDK